MDTGIEFLSSNTQDFIEVVITRQEAIRHPHKFLSSNTQDFIEVANDASSKADQAQIPEL